MPKHNNCNHENNVPEMGDRKSELNTSTRGGSRPGTGFRRSITNASSLISVVARSTPPYCSQDLGTVRMSRSRSFTAFFRRITARFLRIRLLRIPLAILKNEAISYQKEPKKNWKEDFKLLQSLPGSIEKDSFETIYYFLLYKRILFYFQDGQGTSRSPIIG